MYLCGGCLIFSICALHFSSSALVGPGPAPGWLVRLVSPTVLSNRSKPVRVPLSQSVAPVFLLHVHNEAENEENYEEEEN